ncbi:helix-turn-helix transcriptional regulator [Halobacterium noricense]|uniref:helix-turn-helix transcriptional regulator n=1 Tax=Halobacterium noricense TaxID=223182 RepID=UPI001E453163|nr:hypothetical protein [Halobacterium noricense]UHH24621.1 hypothetical protein LT974_11580 [Halobacterium noricense]
MQGSRYARWLVVAVLVAAAAPAVGGASGTQDATSVQPEVDNTVTSIDVAADGSATWTVAVRTRLNSDRAVSDYEAFQQRFRENTSQFLDPYRDRIREVVERAANATGREMTATNFSASTSIQELPRRWGVVTYEFTWRGFAATNGDSVAVGDVFQGGYYLSADDLLELTTPPEYRVANVTPEPDALENGTLRWTGQLDFGDERPDVEYTAAETAPTTTTRAESGGSAFPWLAVAAGFVVVAVAGVVVYRRRRGKTGGDSSEVSAAAVAARASTGATSGPVTDEERVRELLADRGGRVEQAAVAEELDWSPSKTSRVVSRMVEDDDVQKLRVGRRNILELADDAAD